MATKKPPTHFWNFPILVHFPYDFLSKIASSPKATQPPPPPRRVGPLIKYGMDGCCFFWLHQLLDTSKKTRSLPLPFFHQPQSWPRCFATSRSANLKKNKPMMWSELFVFSLPSLPHVILHKTKQKITLLSGWVMPKAHTSLFVMHITEMEQAFVKAVQKIDPAIHMQTFA